MRKQVDEIPVEKIVRLYKALFSAYVPDSTLKLNCSLIKSLAQNDLQTARDFKTDSNLALNTPYIALLIASKGLPAGFGSTRKGEAQSLARRFYELKVRLERPPIRKLNLIRNACERFLSAEQMQRPSANELRWREILPPNFLEKLNTFTNELKSAQFFSSDLERQGKRLAGMMTNTEKRIEDFIEDANGAIATLLYFNLPAIDRYNPDRVIEPVTARSYLLTYTKNVTKILQAHGSNANRSRINYVINFEKRLSTPEAYFFKESLKTAKIADGTELRKIMKLKLRRYSNL